MDAWIRKPVLVCISSLLDSMKYLTSIWTTVILGLVLISVRVSDPQILEQFRLSIFDQYIQSIPVEHSNDIVLINISESSLEAYGQYPWPRQNLSLIHI